nr:NADH kinase isoform X1 [Ipomoea batatas]
MISFENRSKPSEVSRMLNSSQFTNSCQLYALNDILIAHPCPATVFAIKWFKSVNSCWINKQAVLSAGGFAMPILFQGPPVYRKGAPIAPGASHGFMHGVMKHDELMEIAWRATGYLQGARVLNCIVLPGGSQALVPSFGTSYPSSDMQFALAPTFQRIVVA